LTQNCSYHMMTLIEAAAPRVSLVDRLPFWVIPTDTVKATYSEPDLVRQVHFRPSIHTQFKARLARLNAHEEDLLRGVIKREGDMGQMDVGDTAKARIFDAYIDYVDLNHARELVA